MNRKGRNPKPSGWFVGLVKRNTKLSQVVMVKNRNAMTLTNIAIRYISKKASLVISDSWK